MSAFPQHPSQIGPHPIAKKLGEGSFSTVYLTDERPALALKCLNSTLPEEDTVILCFKNEFALLKNLNHPHITRILDFGHDETLNRFYFTTEYLAGQDLFSATENRPVEEVLSLFIQCLRALNYLHAHKIIHFDIKPANILVTMERGKRCCRIIDFGLANFQEKGRLVGSPSTMAPEIIARKTPDHRADIYSLGVVFYTCLTRNNPFSVTKLKDTLHRQLQFEPPPLGDAAVSPVSSFWAEIIHKMILKSPHERYQTAGEILRDLKLYTDLPEIETRETLMSYLPEKGSFIGREQQKSVWKKIFSDFCKNGLYRHVHVYGKTGTGKTRLLQKIRHEVELAGFDAVKFFPIENPLNSRDKIHIQNRKPKVILVDDLDAREHRPSAQHLVQLLSNLICDAPVMLVTTSKERMIPRKLNDFHEQPVHIFLDDFTSGETDEYLRHVLGITKIPTGMCEELQQRTRGNPLLITELLRSMILSGQLFDRHGRLSMQTREDIDIDFSGAKSRALDAILMHEIKQLPSKSMNLLKYFSLAKFPLDVPQMTKLMGDQDISAELNQLISRDLIVRKQNGFVSRHDSLAEILSDHFSWDERKDYHDRISEALDDPESRAWHDIQGSDIKRILSSTQLWGNAYLEKADPRAIEFFKLVRDHLKQMAPERFKDLAAIELKLSEACLIHGRLDDAAHILKDSKKHIQDLDPPDQELLLEHELKLASLFQKSGKTQIAKKNFERALKQAKKFPPDHPKCLSARNLYAAHLLECGEISSAKKIYLSTKHVWMGLSDENKSRVTSNDLGMVYLTERQFEKARAEFAEQLAFFLKTGDRILISRCHYNLAEASAGLGQTDQAVQEFKTAIRHAKSIPNTDLLFCSYNGLGNIYREKDPKDALQYYERALELAEWQDQFAGVLAIRLNIALILSQLSPKQALRSIELLIHFLDERCKTQFEKTILCRAFMEEADLLRRDKRFEQAGHSLQNSRQRDDESGQSYGFWIHLAWHDLEMDQNHFESAREWLKQAKNLARLPEEKLEIQKREIPSLKNDTAPLQSTDNTLSHSTDFSFDHLKENMSMNPYKYILKINRFINSETDLNFVLKTVLNHAIEICRAESGMILLLDDKGNLSVRSIMNLNDAGKLSEFSSTIAKQAISGGECVHTLDAMHDERFENESSILGLHLKSVMCLPIRSKNRTIGALYLENRHQERVFAGLDPEVLEAFTDQVGIAIDNASRFEDLNVKILSVIQKNDSPAITTNPYEEDGIIGNSPAMQNVFALMDKICDTDLSVFIHGASGTGKELIARAHHRHSGRKKNRFVSINCGAIPASLIESELFGHKTGAFTGATRDKKGLFEEAHGGTLFLDEISELHPELQVKLLRVLQEQEVRPLGSSRDIKVNVRVLSASNRDLDELVRQNRFREDLYYRLCQIRLDLPPLKNRPEDIPEIVRYLFKKHAVQNEMTVSADLMRLFLDYDWPGNVRELENLVRVAIALCTGQIMDVSALPPHHPLSEIAKKIPFQPSPAITEKPSTVKIDEYNFYDPEKTWYDYEKIIITSSFVQHQCHAGKTAKDLGIPLPTLFKKIRAMKLRNPDNPLLKNRFHHSPEKKIALYQKEIFLAATRFTGGKVYEAIARLGVSPGYYYRVKSWPQ